MELRDFFARLRHNKGKPKKELLSKKIVKKSNTSK
jgi:hypothetical protein